jgi:septal ring factor EnvC (AmiA/AmiB activator)
MEKKDSEITAEEYAERKRRERLEQNRVSAMESRKRKKTMIEELQRSVIHLSKENKELNDRNDTLRRDLVDLGSKVCVHVLFIYVSTWPKRRENANETFSKFEFFFF